MKKFFRLVSMLALAGLTFTYTSCTDYSEDINANKDRIDAVSGRLATAEEQIKNLGEADVKLQKAIDEANTSIKSLQDNTKSLQDELAALKTKHDTDIQAVKDAHAADKALLVAELGKKADQTALDDLDAKYAGQILKLTEAYTKADSELKQQIEQNVTKITALRTDVDNINNVVIPEVKKQIADLKDDAAKTYATKVELAQATADVIKKVNEATSALSARLDDVEKRLTELSTAHETLKKSFEDAKASYDASIADLKTRLATLEKTHGDDVTAVKALIETANKAIEKAQKAADEAGVAAKKAQETADNAVAAAKTAKEAADAAQADATKALGEIKNLKEILGDYATEKGKLAADIDNITENIKGLTAKTVALETTTADLVAKYSDLAAQDEEFAKVIDTLKKKDAKLGDKIDQVAKDADAALTAAKKDLQDQIDELSKTLEEKLKDLADVDKDLQDQIDNIFAGEKFANAFKGQFDKAFDGVDYKTAFANLFKTAFGVDGEGNGRDYETAFTALFNEAFKTAFVDAEGKAVDFSTAFGSLFNKAFSTAFDNADYKTAFNAAIAEALKDDAENPGEIFKTINAQIAGFKSEYFDKLDSKVSEIKGTVDDIILVVGDLANRIQSVVFVPEYDDMCATLHYYYIKDASDKILPFSDTKTVDATFEVYPAKLAGTITLEDVSVVAVNVATRAADAVPGEILPETFKKDVNTGRVSFTVKFGKEVSYDSAAKKSFAISMRVKDNAKQTVDEKEYETGNYVESSFVGVSLCEDSDLTGKFVVYNGKGVLASGATIQTEKQWSAAPAAWDPFEGYDFYIKLGTAAKPEYLTLAEAAAKFNLDVKDITPVLKNTPSFSPAASSKYFEHKGKDKAVVLGDLTTAMIKDKVIKADGTVDADAVGSVCKDVVKATVKGVEIFNATTSYKIGRRKVTMTIDPYTIDWTYGTAVKLSSAKTAAGAYKNAINAAVLEDELLKELKVTVEGEVEGLDIKKVVDGVTPVANHTLNGKAIPAGSLKPSLKVDPLAIINAHLATIEIAGGTYEFGKAGVPNVYSLCNTYANDPTFTDVDVKMTLTLGSRPNPVKVDLPKLEIAYEPEVVLHKLTEAATIDAAFNQEGVKSGFKDLKEFKDDFLAGTETVVKSQRVNVNPVVNCSDYTYFSVTNRVLADVPFIRLSQADLKSYKDMFAFETKVDTWYGVSYRFATTASLLKPAYSLIYHEDLVDMNKEIPTVTIKGTKATGIYEINTDDLSKYFGVEKCNATVANFLKIKYEYVSPLATAEWEAKGYENRPYLAGTAYESTIDGAAGEIEADGSIKENPVVWGDFTARDMVVRATLLCNGVEVNALDLKLTIEDPIKEVSITDIAVKREPYADVTVNLWQTTTVKSILSDDNQVNQTAATKADMWKWNADAAYGLDLTYDTKYTVFVKGKDVTAQFPASKLVFDAAAGTILYKKDAAHQVNDVKIEVTAHLTHKFNYNNKNTEEVHKDTYKFYVVISE